MRITLLLIMLLLSTNSCSQKIYTVKSHFIKKEFQIPMRDGVKLFTSVYIPIDTNKTYPILLQRTPYRAGPYGPDILKEHIGPSDRFAEDGYIFVYQDVRGRFMSEGNYVNMRPYLAQKTDSMDIDESSDTYDTIEWLVNNISANNGNVGMWGISYPGFYTAMGMIDAHPALKAVSPQAPIADWFIGDDMHHHGAFSLTLAFNFFSTFGQPRSGLTKSWPKRFKHKTPDGYQFFLELGPLANANKRYFKHRIPFWDSLMTHSTYNAFWQERNILPHIKNIRPAVLIVGGWFDAEDLYGPLQIYKQLQDSSVQTTRYLVMGPWSHGAWGRSSGESLGDIHFGSKTSQYYQQEIELPFFNHFLKNGNSISINRVTCFDTGNDSWHSYKNWPPRETVASVVYLSANGKLDFNQPIDSLGYNSFISDPANPVPFINKITNTWDRTYMTADQRFAYTRPDVLTFQTEVMDSSLTFAGTIDAELFVSTSGTDCDWIVKLIDVFPDTSSEKSAMECGLPMGGYQQLVRAEIMRSKFRNSYEHPQAMIPNQITKITIPLQDVLHTFKKGHKIMVQIQSSWFPLFDRNPQKFVDIYTAEEADFQKAEQHVYYSVQYPSQLIFKKLN